MKTVVDLVSTLKTYFVGKDTTAKQAVENTIATVEADATSASKGYSIGDQLYLEDILYDVTASITAGDPLTVGTNIEVAPKLAASVSGKQDQIEVTTMPTASAAYLGKVLIYIGATTQHYTSGQSYQCVEESASYSWVPVGIAADDVTYDNSNSGLSATNTQGAIDELAPIILVQSAAIGATSVTFTNAAITNAHRYLIYCNDTSVEYTSKSQSGTSITVNFDALEAATDFQLEIRG